eukprot:TRINITY_DN48020_c0_g1_i1.p1 TRINITY_DN48020_c0_g1~~TRINITY_DN48020_c0_g1_i1.p1  ORF type:complete len:268 (+),score=31.89 TRINITY_DN48020_c0_g1_i1:93-896(+)
MASSRPATLQCAAFGQGTIGEQILSSLVHRDKSTPDVDKFNDINLELVWRDFDRRCGPRIDLTVDEFRVALREYGVVDEVALAVLVNIFDVNMDGRIEWKEFLVAIAKAAGDGSTSVATAPRKEPAAPLGASASCRSASSSQAALGATRSRSNSRTPSRAAATSRRNFLFKRCFRVLDTNASATLSRSELIALAKGQPPTVPPYVAAVADHVLNHFDTIDESANGYITYAEFDARMRTDPVLVQAFFPLLLMTIAQLEMKRVGGRKG